MNCAIKQLIGANGYSPAVAAVSNIANGAGGSAGAAVTVALTFEDQYGNGTLPANYSVVGGAEPSLHGVGHVQDHLGLLGCPDTAIWRDARGRYVRRCRSRLKTNHESSA
jgi:hypothetical protein